jgi:hypothetical protein
MAPNGRQFTGGNDDRAGILHDSRSDVPTPQRCTGPEGRASSRFAWRIEAEIDQRGWPALLEAVAPGSSGTIHASLLGSSPKTTVYRRTSLKNLEAVVTDSAPIRLRALIAQCCGAAGFSETTHSEVAASCTIPPRENGLVLNFRIPDHEAMRVIHEILHSFDAPMTDEGRSADLSCRLISVGISNVEPEGALR